MIDFVRTSSGFLCLALALSSGCTTWQEVGDVQADGTAISQPSSLTGAEPAFDPEENARAEALYASIYQARSARSPIDQAFEGILDQQDRWDNLSDAFLMESHRLDQAHLQNLQALNPQLLSDANQLNLRLYQQELAGALEEFKWRYHRYPISHMTGIHTGVATVLIGLHRIETVEDAKAYIKRLHGVTQLFEQLIDGLQTRAEMVIVAPRFVYQQAVESAQRIITGQPFADSGPVDSPLMADFSRKLETLDIAAQQQQQLQSGAQQALLESVGPAYRKLIAVLNSLHNRAEVEGAIKATCLIFLPICKPIRASFFRKQRKVNRLISRKPNG